MLSYQELPTSIQLWRGHGQEAKRGEAGRHRITRNCEALGSFLLPCAITELSLIAMWCPIGATPWGQPWTPVLTLPHVHDGLRVLLMAVLWTFRRLSMCRPAHRQLTRNELPDVTTIIPATTCHQRNYVEAYSRFRPRGASLKRRAWGMPSGRRFPVCQSGTGHVRTPHAPGSATGDHGPHATGSGVRSVDRSELIIRESVATQVRRAPCRRQRPHARSP